MPIPSHFEILGLPEHFDVDLERLEEHYQRLMKSYHPDNFSCEPAVVKRSAMQMATNVNMAYETLKSPIKRAKYWLSKKGFQTDLEKTVSLSPEFLMQQIQWREEIASSNRAELMETAKALSEKLKSFEAYFVELSMSEDALKTSGQNCLAEWQFFEKLANLLQEKGVLLP